MVAKAFQNIWDGQSDTSPNRKCPKDNISLYLFTFKGVELDFCMLCRGLWFDVFEMERFNSVEDKENPKAINPGTGNGYSLGGEIAAEVALESLFEILAV